MSNTVEIGPDLACAAMPPGPLASPRVRSGGLCHGTAAMGGDSPQCPELTTRRDADNWESPPLTPNLY